MFQGADVGIREPELIETNLYLPIFSQTLSKWHIFVHLLIFHAFPYKLLIERWDLGGSRTTPVILFSSPKGSWNTVSRHVVSGFQLGQFHPIGN